MKCVKKYSVNEKNYIKNHFHQNFFYSNKMYLFKKMLSSRKQQLKLTEQKQRLFFTYPI